MIGSLSYTETRAVLVKVNALANNVLSKSCGGAIVFATLLRNDPPDSFPISEPLKRKEVAGQLDERHLSKLHAGDLFKCTKQICVSSDPICSREKTMLAPRANKPLYLFNSGSERSPRRPKNKLYNE